ncbi:amidohydrolase [Tamlana sp. 2201CG12-4]|uniref:amidohydrolase n=1 Tax=Tamlana sp. 2201CG12-4 TaxID=3112582 RepID=UPI002DBFCBE6|nr:amidohydrolase [Tamlana sp. 2201CG12-4]MEC3907917.1 amidohydrolase [Tamlana sp. 2201CG12-4]
MKTAKIFNRLGICVMITLLFACNTQNKAEPTSTLYHNGDIITMNGDQPSYVEAVVEEAGEIIFAGALDEAKTKFKNSKTKDLNGKTMLPGFIDSHSHFSIALGLVNQVNLTSPPMGNIRNFNDILDALLDFKNKNNIAEGEWVIGWGYDPNQLEEKKDITKVELDSILSEHKVMLVHISNHGAVLNSKALEWAGITAETEQPAGGIIARMEGSKEPAGMIFETAWLPVKSNKPTATEEEMMKNIEKVVELYAANGYTHAQDGASFTKEALFLKKAASQGKLKIDVAALMIFAEIDQWMDHPEISFDGKYTDGLKIQGVKIIQDGSPQGKTSYMSKEYLTGGPAGETNWFGEPTLTREQFTQLFQKTWNAGLQPFTHVNGDAAIDDLIYALESVGATADQDRRTVTIHTQFQRPDQIEKFVQYGISPSYFTNHCFYWGDEHLANQGQERGGFISPMKSAVNAGLVVSNHSDYNVNPLDPFFILWTSMTRVTRGGVKLDQNEVLTAYEGLQSLTVGGAYQMFEENRKGMIKEGLLADFVILDKNPLKVNTDAIKNINVMETIKEGVTVYKKD